MPRVEPRLERREIGCKHGHRHGVGGGKVNINIRCAALSHLVSLAMKLLVDGIVLSLARSATLAQRWHGCLLSHLTLVLEHLKQARVARCSAAWERVPRF